MTTRNENGEKALAKVENGWFEKWLCTAGYLGGYMGTPNQFGIVRLSQSPKIRLFWFRPKKVLKKGQKVARFGT